MEKSNNSTRYCNNRNFEIVKLGKIKKMFYFKNC